MWPVSMEPGSWSALRSLAQLTSLRLMAEDKDGSHLQHIAAAAPQLQQLHYRTSNMLGSQHGASSLASLRSLASLHLQLPKDGGAQLVVALAALPGLTHLGLALYRDCSSELLQLMQALGQKTQHVFANGSKKHEIRGFK
jgi:hypothetical protein